MQSLRSICASYTAIAQLPEFVDKLKYLRTLEVGCLCLVPNQGRVIKSLSTFLTCLALEIYGLSEAAFRVDGSLYW